MLEHLSACEAEHTARVAELLAKIKELSLRGGPVTRAPVNITTRGVADDWDDGSGVCVCVCVCVVYVFSLSFSLCTNTNVRLVSISHLILFIIFFYSHTFLLIYTFAHMYVTRCGNGSPIGSADWTSAERAGQA